MKCIYLDHSATTAVEPEVVTAMSPYFHVHFGNPSSLYSIAEVSRNAMEESRSTIASFIGANANEIFFTSGGTESDNQAILTTARKQKNKGQHVITSSIEHHAVLHAFQQLEKEGFQVTYLPVDSYGIVHPETLQKAMTPATTLVSIMHANNEVGTIQDIPALTKIAHAHGALFHTDAVQAIGKLPVDVQTLDVDLLSSSAHKLYGPKGVGFLYAKKGTPFSTFLYGGGQEKKKRPGTENVPGIVGFAKAIEIAKKRFEEDHQHLQNLATFLTEGIQSSVSDVVFTGHPILRTPGHVSVCFKYIEGESILMMLDSFGICVSSGSACTSGSLDASHVLLAMGLDSATAQGSIRFSMGRMNTMDDMKAVIEVLPGIVEKLRKMSPLC
ncbi:MAG TPA: cysteine desulfurase NifS [Caldisericia bacterium]|nr:cysteine desulfurase NifS [Caldisericia bacterium]